MIRWKLNPQAGSAPARSTDGHAGLGLPPPLPGLDRSKLREYLISSLVNYCTTMRTHPKRSPGRPPARSDAGARNLLLAAATELFAERGVAATSFAVIAKRAGLTPAMMHYYFRDRDHLLDVVVEEKIGPLIASVWEPVTAGIAPPALLTGIVERLLAGIERNPWVPSTWMREVLSERGLLRNRVVRHLPLDKVQIFSKAIAREQRRGKFNADIDPVLIVFSTLGLIMLHSATARFFAAVFHRRVPAGDELQRHIAALLLHGLQTGSNRSRKEGRQR